MKQHQIILFDGICNFCNFWVNFILDRDKRDIFRFAALQSDAGQELLQKLRLKTTDFDTFILIDGETYFSKSTAAIRIAKNLSGPIKIFYLLIYLPKFLRDLFYEMIAKNRYKFFGKRDTCRIPGDEEKMRFL